MYPPTSYPKRRQFSTHVSKRPTPSYTAVLTTGSTWLWNLARCLLRRPLLLLTLCISAVLLTSALGEALAASRIDVQVSQAQTANHAVQDEIQGIQEHTAALTTDAAIITAAQKLGYTFPLAGR